MNWIQNMNRCVGPATWDAGKPKETTMSTKQAVETAANWRVRFETHDGHFTFSDLTMPNGNLTRAEAENWAAVTLKENPSRFARVANVINLDDDA